MPATSGLTRQISNKQTSHKHNNKRCPPPAAFAARVPPQLELSSNLSSSNLSLILVILVVIVAGRSSGGLRRPPQLELEVRSVPPPEGWTARSCPRRDPRRSGSWRCGPCRSPPLRTLSFSLLASSPLGVPSTTLSTIPLVCSGHPSDHSGFLGT